MTSALTGDALLAFLGRQRWFGAKGATATAARVVDTITLPWGDGVFAIVRVSVSVGGETRAYQVPLAVRNVLPSNAPDAAIVARDGQLIIYDAVYDDDFRRGLADALATGMSVDGTDGSRWVIEPVGTIAAADADGTTTVGSAEQSNTSIVIGDRTIIKLFRTLSAGVHPEVEVTRFLTTRANFSNTPALRATIRFEDNDIQTVAGMAQEYLPGSTDAWSYALDRGRAYFSAPETREVSNAFAEDAKQLGVVTRALHEALATDDDDPAFAPEPVEPEDLDRWALKSQQSLREALALLESQLSSSSFPKDRVAEAQALVRRRDHYVGWINEIADNIGDDLGMRIRIHGDYHLGQVLRTRGGEFAIIDFEGEPSRPLDERREKASPLRDVAGMLRSFGYAAATLAMEAKTVQPHTREIRAGRWERDVRAAFLAGYFGTPDDENLLPDDENHARQLISLFETEKAFYELSYELNNRPAWAWIPMRGIAKLFTTAASS